MRPRARGGHMKLAAKSDVEAPAPFVFAQLADFEGWERAAMRRGAEVIRTDNLRSSAPGMTWDTMFNYRGKDRRATIRLDALSPTTHLALSGKAAPVDGVLTIDILDLGGKTHPDRGAAGGQTQEHRRPHLCAIAAAGTVTCRAQLCPARRPGRSSPRAGRQRNQPRRSPWRRGRWSGPGRGGSKR